MPNYSGYPDPQQPVNYSGYYGIPQRQVGPDGQIVGTPAPGGGVNPPGAINPFTGQPLSTQMSGMPGNPGFPVVLPYYNEATPGSQDLDIVTTNIINVNTATGLAAASTAATTLANAYGFNLSGVTPSSLILTPASVTTPVTLISYLPVSPGVFKKFGVHIRSAMGLRAIRIQIQVNGVNLPGLTEVEMSSFFEGNNPASIFVPFRSQDIITVAARNIDLNSAYLVTTRLSGWRSPG